MERGSTGQPDTALSLGKSLHQEFIAELWLIQMTQTTVFVVSAPGPLLDGLKAILATLPSIIPLGCLDITKPELCEIEKAHPHVIIMNPSPTEEGLCEFVREITFCFPSTHSIVMTKHADRRTRLLKAGAGNVWIKGMSATELVGRLENLLYV